MVSIPRHHWRALCTSIKEADLGRWSYISTADKDCVTLCTFICSSPPTISMTITISSLTPDNNWSLHIGHLHVSGEQVDCLPTTVHYLSDLHTILNGIDKCNLCIGSDDKKFTPIIESHNGSFNNQYGKCYFLIL